MLDMDTFVSEKFASSILNLTHESKGYCYKFNRRVKKNPFHKKNNQIHLQFALLELRITGMSGDAKKIL